MKRAKSTNAIAPRIKWSRVWPAIAPWRWMLAGATISVIAGAGLALLPPLILRRLIDDNLSTGRVEGIFFLALCYLGAIAAVHLTDFLTAYASSIAAQGALRRLRVQLFDHLQNLPVSYHDHTPVGDSISRCTADMETIDNLFSSGVISLLAESLRLVVTFAAMLALSLPLSLALILTLPVLVTMSRRFQVLMRKAQRELRKAVGKLNARLQETLIRTEVIRAFAWEIRIVQRIRRILAETLRLQNRSIAYGAAYDPLLKILQAGLVAAFLIMSSSPILKAAQISIGTLTAFIFLFDQFFQPLIRIGNEWQVVQGALAGLERVFEVMSLSADELVGSNKDDAAVSTAVETEVGTAVETAAERDVKTVQKTGGAEKKDTARRDMVEVSHITFGYRDEMPVIKDLSLRVQSGKHLAVVGRTGAGKSSLIHLLGGLYRPWKGTIRLDGHDPNKLPPDKRRQLLGVVPQAGWMFGGSVADNLTLGDKTISRKVVEKAARISGAESFVTALPAGYDTIISDVGRGEGIQLSAGQLQLLALARALVGDPSVLLLDEATAAVDSATESAFKRALRAQIEERQCAVITIAHRLSTAMESDYIVVMEEGRIVEAGLPTELLRSGGSFASLCELENAGWEWREQAAVNSKRSF